MQKYLLPSLLISSFFISPLAHALEGYLGENPGFDFYSKIDSGTYTIQQKLVAQKIKKSGNFGTFGKNCNGISNISENPIDEKVLEGIANQNYTGLSTLLKGKNISTDQFQALTICLAEEYKNVKSDIAKEQSARETVASIGLYADGDKSNSDYDIIYDIERINQIIFSTEIKYNGTKNIANKSLASLLAGNSPTPLLSATASIIAPVVPSATGPTATPAPISGAAAIADLLGSTCTNSGMTGPVDATVDETFAQELAAVIGGVTPSAATSGFSATTSPVAASGTTAPPARTAANDFFHKMPCGPGVMFCIDVKTIPGGNITLGGGKNVSIEGILDTFSKHLLPISESSLAYQKMTNNAGSLPIKNLQLWKTIGGLRVYLGNQPQPSRRDKSQQTPERDKSELAAIIECGYISAGLPTDMARANSIGGAGYAGKGDTTDIKSMDMQRLGVQEAVSTAKLTGCMNEYMSEGRQTYYTSLSTDLTEIQAFTMSMISEIRDIATILEAMNDKPVK